MISFPITTWVFWEFSVF